MPALEFEFLIYAVCLIAFLTIVLPVPIYLATTWRIRRQNFCETMTVSVLKRYYKQFYPTRDLTNADLTAMFRTDFNRRYGIRIYIVPLSLLSMISGIALWCVARTILTWLDTTPESGHISLSGVATSALLGGLTWVISDQLSRFRTRDFTSHDVYNSVFRCLISVPLGLSVAVFCDDKFKPAIAFLLGAFPTSSLFTIMRRLGTDKLKISDDNVNGGSELEKLPSVGKAFAERLKDEGISSIDDLAYFDPIELCIRTNKSFAYVGDCVNQALLWNYVGDGLLKLTLFGIRGAQEANYLLGDLNASNDPDRNAQAQSTLVAAANAIGMSPDAFKTTLEEVGYDPYTLFLVQVWG
jgi:hypothetical protein